MIETASLGNLFTIFFTSVMVILLGKLNALLFAFSRVRGDSRLMPQAYHSYACLWISGVIKM